MIYARDRNMVGVLDDGCFLCQPVLYTENVPETFPENGNGIIGMSNKDVFAAGTCLICTVDKKVFLIGEDKGSFNLWRDYNE